MPVFSSPTSRSARRHPGADGLEVVMRSFLGCFDGLFQRVKLIPSPGHGALQVYQSPRLERLPSNPVRDGLYALHLAECKEGVWYSGAYGETAPVGRSRSGHYPVLVHDHVNYRYEILGLLGTGAYAQVVRAYDHKDEQVVALKLVRNESALQKQALREAEALQYIQEQAHFKTSHIVEMKTAFEFRGHLCMAFELLAETLFDRLKLHDYVGLPMQQVRQVATQLFTAVDFLSQHGIIHGDLKPENIIFTGQDDTCIKVIDFGLASYSANADLPRLQSRFYRAPEVILTLPYGPAVDIWSCGCILAEMCCGAPLLPGSSDREQLKLMSARLGPAPGELVRRSSRGDFFFDSSGSVRSLQQSDASSGGGFDLEEKKLMEMFGEGDPDLLSLARGLLEWSAERRLTAAEALEQPWVAPTRPTEANCPGFRRGCLAVDAYDDLASESTDAIEEIQSSGPDLESVVSSRCVSISEDF
eukprot:TRINITY_DN110742_c0_g1_i1.p1 TRINITY_DN110742_c0_g1~~TRINITY_DN110742_c0_g1_i1.p1  ORF type:complete len:473 (-),score=56.93 TRINITY_DN110742_c0_g1_i1:119-1537(-)